jgi:hypothetical protein
MPVNAKLDFSGMAISALQYVQTVKFLIPYLTSVSVLLAKFGTVIHVQAASFVPAIKYGMFKLANVNAWLVKLGMDILVRIHQITVKTVNFGMHKKIFANAPITKYGMVIFVNPLLAETANILIKIQINASALQVRLGMVIRVLAPFFAQMEGLGTLISGYVNAIML